MFSVIDNSCIEIYIFRSYKFENMCILIIPQDKNYLMQERAIYLDSPFFAVKLCTLYKNLTVRTTERTASSMVNQALQTSST